MIESFHIITGEVLDTCVLTSSPSQMDEYWCDIFGYHIWLQSDAAFVYPRLDKYSLSVRMFWSTCGLSRSTLGRLATASSLAGNVS